MIRRVAEGWSKAARAEKLTIEGATIAPARRKELTAAVRKLVDQALAKGREDFRSEVGIAETMQEPSGTRARSAERYLATKAFWITGVLARSIEAQAQAVLVETLRDGASGRETAERLSAVLEPWVGDQVAPEVTTPHRLETIVRTNTTDAYNQGRLVEMRDPEVVPFVKAVQYSAIIDTRTTEICRTLDNRVFRLGDADLDRFSPPNHFSCRSVLVPVILEDEVEADSLIDAQTKGRVSGLMQPGFGGSPSS